MFKTALRIGCAAAPDRQVRYPDDMHIAAMRNGQNISLPDHHMRAVNPAAIQPDMPRIGQFFRHRPIARKAQKPKQLVNPEHRVVRTGVSGFLILQRGVPIFAKLYSPNLFACFSSISSLSLLVQPVRQKPRQP